MTITDETGALLWPAAAPAAPAAVGATAKLAAAAGVRRPAVGQIDAMLARTLGPDKAEARVHASST